MAIQEIKESGVGASTIDQLFEAIRNQDAVTVERLTAADPSILAKRNAQGISPLSWAAYLDQPGMVEVLRARRGAPDFHEACIVGDEGAVRAALARGQAINAFAPDGFTPVALAVFFRQPAIARLLIDAGADINLRARNAQQVGPIHAAVARNDVQTLELLLLRGADPDAPQEKLVRPIHVAASAGSTTAVALLLMYGADPAAKTEDGGTPAEMARKNGHAMADRLEAIAASRTDSRGSEHSRWANRSQGRET